MKSYTYPAIFIKDQENDGYQVLFPDLEVTSKGEFIEEAFLYAKATLKAYFVYIVLKIFHSLVVKNFLVFP